MWRLREVRHQNIHHEKRKEATAKKQQNSVDAVQETLDKLIDCEATRIGLSIAKIFKTLAATAASLSDMGLHTEFMHLIIDEDETSRKNPEYTRRSGTTATGWVRWVCSLSLCG